MSEWLLRQTQYGDVRICDDRITEVSSHSVIGDAQIIDCEGCALFPGQVNAHTHLYSGLAPLGMPAPTVAPQNFVQILERIWWRLDRALDADSLRAAARYYISSALLMGTTTLVDHHESPALIAGSLDILADACAELGCRALLTYGATERNFGRREGDAGLSECRRFIVTNQRPFVRGLVGLHASFTVSDETILAAGQLCRELGTVMHVHVAEDLADVEDAKKRGYRDPLDRLLRLAALPPGSIVAHGVHLDADSVRRCQDEGLWLVQNPRSNFGNRVGYPHALSCSARVALGTDGYPANMAEEEAALWTRAKQFGETDSVISQRAQSGHILVAERFALPAFAIAVGSPADLVVRDPSGQVRHVFCAGKLVVRDGTLVTADRQEIEHDAQQKAFHLWNRMTAL